MCEVRVHAVSMYTYAANSREMVRAYTGNAYPSSVPRSGPTSGMPSFRLPWNAICREHCLILSYFWYTVPYLTFILRLNCSCQPVYFPNSKTYFVWGYYDYPLMFWQILLIDNYIIWVLSSLMMCTGLKLPSDALQLFVLIYIYLCKMVMNSIYDSNFVIHVLLSYCPLGRWLCWWTVVPEVTLAWQSDLFRHGMDNLHISTIIDCSEVRHYLMI